MPEDQPSGQKTSHLQLQRLGHDPKSATLMHSQKSFGQSIMRKSGMGLRGTAHWETIMRKFSDAHKETCKSVPKELPQTHRNLKKFPTGSTYAGTWNLLGMSGEGTYTFPHGGVVYKGGFEDGMFHGDGELQYECGAVIKGKWKKGKLFERHLFFADGLEYQESDWGYCRPSDRRFTIEYDEGLEPAGRSYLTAEQPTIPIPPGYYDVGDGFYDPVTKLVYKYNDLSAIERAPREREQQWTLENCRKNPDISVGPCPFLYEKWVQPTLEAPIIPRPGLQCNANQETESDDDQTYQHQISGRSRGHLFTSRIGLGSNTAFYCPGRDGLDSTNELKDSSLKCLIAPTKSDTQKVSSVAFKVSSPSQDFMAVSDMGLVDRSSFTKSKSYNDQSDFIKLDPKSEKSDIRAVSSFKVPISTQQLEPQSSHTKDPETYKSKIEADQYDADNIQAERSMIKPELSFNIPISTPKFSQRFTYEQETAQDPDTYKSKTEADKHDSDNIQAERSEIKPELLLQLPVSTQKLERQSDYKQETTRDPETSESKTGTGQFGYNMKAEESVTQPKQSEYVEENTHVQHPETKISITTAQGPETNMSMTNAQGLEPNKSVTNA